MITRARSEIDRIIATHQQGLAPAPSAARTPILVLAPQQGGPSGHRARIHRPGFDFGKDLPGAFQKHLVYILPAQGTRLQEGAVLFLGESRRLEKGNASLILKVDLRCRVWGCGGEGWAMDC